MHRSRPVALTIAGSDSSCGAGIQADIRTFCHFGCFPQSSLTCAVSEVPGEVSLIETLPPGFVVDQIRLSFRHFPVAAVKTGMLTSGEVVQAVAEYLATIRVPLVVDPVMVASSGDPLLEPGAVEIYQCALFPLATLLTPNADELGFLVGRSIRCLDELLDAGQSLSRQVGCAVLAKGGHISGTLATDFLITPDGYDEFSSPFIKGVSTHGTGCSYSAAITAGLAKGLRLPEAVHSAKAFISRAIADHYEWKTTTALKLEE